MNTEELNEDSDDMQCIKKAKIIMKAVKIFLIIYIPIILILTFIKS